MNNVEKYKKKKKKDNLLKFYIPEIILFLIYFIMGLLVTIKKTDFLLGGLLFGSVGYIFFILEHKIYIVFNKAQNIVYIKEKSLFLNIMRIRDFTTFSNISNAALDIKNRPNSNGHYTQLYTIKFICKDGKVIFPLGHSYSNGQEKFLKLVEKVNTYIRSDETELKLVESPCFFRLFFGIPFSFFYLSGCLYILSPELGKQLIMFIMILFMGQPE